MECVLFFQSIKDLNCEGQALNAARERIRPTKKDMVDLEAVCKPVIILLILLARNSGVNANPKHKESAGPFTAQKISDLFDRIWTNCEEQVNAATDMIAAIKETDSKVPLVDAIDCLRREAYFAKKAARQRANPNKDPTPKDLQADLDSIMKFKVINIASRIWSWITYIEPKYTRPEFAAELKETFKNDTNTMEKCGDSVKQSEAAFLERVKKLGKMKVPIGEATDCLRRQRMETIKGQNKDSVNRRISTLVDITPMMLVSFLKTRIAPDAKLSATFGEVIESGKCGDVFVAARDDIVALQLFASNPVRVPPKLEAAIDCLYKQQDPKWTPPKTRPMKQYYKMAIFLKQKIAALLKIHGPAIIAAGKEVSVRKAAAAETDEDLAAIHEDEEDEQQQDATDFR